MNQKRQVGEVLKMLDEARRKVRQARDHVAAVEQWKAARCREYAGDLYDDMLTRRSVAEQSLRNPTSKVRLVAVDVLTYHWGARSPDGCVAVFEELAFTDPSEEVRVAAICAVGETYKSTNDVQVGRTFARLVQDESADVDIRRAAYLALYSLRGADAPIWPGIFAHPFVMLRVPEDIDWDFVRSFI